VLIDKGLRLKRLVQQDPDVIRRQERNNRKVNNNIFFIRYQQSSFLGALLYPRNAHMAAGIFHMWMAS
jgi:hypothetical protein